jgi:putative transposase
MLYYKYKCEVILLATANRAIKYRIYPNAEQQVLLAKTFGCARFIYNKMLGDKIENYNKTKTMLNNTPAQYKDEFPWLKEVDSLALANAQLNLQTAYNNFFRSPKIGFPKFKSKHKSSSSYTTNNQHGTVYLAEKGIRLPKIGVIKAKLHRLPAFDWKLKSATISKSASGKYYCSILFEFDTVPLYVVPSEETTLGLDYSSPHFYVDSNGNEANYSRYYRCSEKKLAKEQKRLSRMKKGSANYSKQRIVVAALHEHVANQRRDFCHKLSRKIANSYYAVCVEDINLRGMAGSLKLGKSTNDNGFGMFRTMLEYKLREQGKQLIVINKWFPSSKLCRHCGTINQKLSLSDRTWICPSCGALISRDYNAAINIKEAGLNQYFAGVRSA